MGTTAHFDPNKSGGWTVNKGIPKKTKILLVSNDGLSKYTNDYTDIFVYEEEENNDMFQWKLDSKRTYQTSRVKLS